MMYYYKPDPVYQKNLRTYFLKSKIEKFILLKKPGLLFLKSNRTQDLRNTKKRLTKSLKSLEKQLLKK